MRVFAQRGRRKAFEIARGRSLTDCLGSVKRWSGPRAKTLYWRFYIVSGPRRWRVVDVLTNPRAIRSDT